MFKIVTNEFIDTGKVIYENDNGDKLIALRTDDGYKMKVRFHDKSLTAKPIEVILPPKGDGTTYLYMYCNDKPYFDENIANEFLEIKSRWDNMIILVKRFSMPNSILIESGYCKTQEECWQAKCESLYQFEELKDFIDNICS